MENLEEKMGAILNNPQLMQQIMSMAQSLGQSSPQPRESPPPQEPPQVDMAMIQKLSGLAGQSGIDPNQKALLQALHPYLSSNRVEKLEKAMRAAKVAGFASTAVGGIGSIFSLGR